MLQQITIHNYALISHLEISFPEGFSVITGETGSGKSIILGALSLILGQRVDSKYIKQGENKCVIEGIFNISSYHLESLFKEHDLEYDPEQCILRREIWDSGKSRAFINDSPVNLNELKELGAILIDIHSQHQNLLLKDNKFQLNVLDTLGENKNIKQQYIQSFTTYISLKKDLEELKNKAIAFRKEEDYLRHQYIQLEEAGLKPNEQEEIESELQLLSHVEEIKTGLYKLEQGFSNDTTGVIYTLKELLSVAESLQKIYPNANEFAERIETAYIDLKELNYSIASAQDKLEFDPDRYRELSERLDLIYSLQQKHQLNTNIELIALRDELKNKLDEIDNYDEDIVRIEKEVQSAYSSTLKKAEDLSGKRKKAALLLKEKLTSFVQKLGMPNINFEVELKPKQTPDPTGIDQVEYLFSSSKNGFLKPISQIASGGEISRLMLGIKTLIAGTGTLPTIILDEIDTGVSGEIASKMGEIMHEMGKTMQVITISHLPQIAAQGKAQYKVYKEDSEQSTETYIRLLNEEERITEIAQMLSGSTLTEAAINNAKELLKQKK
ncbi:DNA repair protein RecN [Bacteroidales bacterium OttesenSCG-928-M11]|nr:DNA repair protein RecN [Bacteroidales bacterium OttesenSCG-928-M11]